VIVFYSNHGAVFGKGELGAVYLIGYLTLILLGPGNISVDRLIGK